MGNRDIRGSVESEGMGAENMGYTRWTLQGLSGRKAGNLKEVGLGWINGGRKDRGFGWGTTFGCSHFCSWPLWNVMGLKCFLWLVSLWRPASLALLNKVLNLSIHSGPVNAFSGSSYTSVHSQMRRLNSLHQELVIPS